MLKCRPLESVAPHVFTTRGVPLVSDEDWQRIGEMLGAGEMALLTQVHGAHVVVLRQGGGAPAPSGRPPADILVSNRPETAVAVRAADCVPLLLADSRTGAVAAVHAGWRGTAAGAARTAVAAMVREFGTVPEHLVAAIGPSIRSCCYGVGRELVDAFAAAGHPSRVIDRWFAPPAGSSLRLDLPQANRDQLMEMGVPDAHIHDCGLCTAMHLDVLTSYRVEKETAGRIVAVIRRRENVARPPDPSLR